MTGEFGHRIRGGARPVHAAVHLDQDAERVPDPAGYARVAVGNFHRVGDKRHIGGLADRGEAAELSLAHHRIGQGQVGNDGGREDRGLGDRGRAQPGRTCGQLAAGHRRGLVRLQVRPELQPGAAGKRGHLRDVRLGDVKIDEHSRGVQALVTGRHREHRRWIKGERQLPGGRGVSICGTSHDATTTVLT